MEGGLGETIGLRLGFNGYAGGLGLSKSLLGALWPLLGALWPSSGRLRYDFYVFCVDFFSLSTLDFDLEANWSRFSKVFIDFLVRFGIPK